MVMTILTVVGGGLAGCEAAWQAAQHDLDVVLYEMRPAQSTGAHVTEDLAELVITSYSIHYTKLYDLLQKGDFLSDEFLQEVRALIK